MPAPAKQTPSNSDAGAYGWPLEKRIKFLADAESSGATFPIVFMGKKQDLSVKRVPIGLPKYRLENGRTASSQLEYLAKNPGLGDDFFTGDAERTDVQTAQHSILQTLIDASGLRKKFEDTSVTQIDPLVLDWNGYVINGNRRLCTWRTLYASDPKKWQQYSHVDVVVLPTADDQAIDQLEASLQIEKDVKADYTWEARALMMKMRRDVHNFSDEELSKLYGQKIPDIRRQFAMLEAASEYLDSRKKSNLWSEVADNELAFAKLVESREAVSGIDSKALFKETAFVLIDNPADVGERLYKAIPDVKKYLAPIRDALLEEIKIDAATTVVDPFGDGQPASTSFLLSAAIADPENSSRVRAVVREVVENQRAAERDEQSAQHLLKLVQRANTTLQNALQSALRDTADRTGVGAQLDAIDAASAKIRQWLDA